MVLVAVGQEPCFTRTPWGRPIASPARLTISPLRQKLYVHGSRTSKATRTAELATGIRRWQIPTPREFIDFVQLLNPDSGVISADSLLLRRGALVSLLLRSP